MIVGLNINNAGSFIFGMAIAFAFSWRVTLVCLALSPALIIASVI